MSKYLEKRYLTKQEKTLTKKFTVKYSNSGKSDVLKDIQKDVCLFKNEIADFIKSNPDYLMSKKSFNILKKMYKDFKNSPHLKYLIGSEYQNIYKDCCILSKNILDEHIKNVKCYQIKDYKFTYYKRAGKRRNGGTYRKGDLKGVSYKRVKNTNLVKMINYLIWLDDETVSTMQLLLEASNKDMGSLFYLYSKDKPNLFKRMIDYSRHLRNKALKRFQNFEFKTGSHRKSVSPNGKDTYNQIIIDKTNSKYKYWLQYYYRSPDTNKGTKIHIPLMINKEYHSNINDIIKNNKSFNIILRGKKIIIDATFAPEQRKFKDFKEFRNTIAMDVNLKNNILSTNEHDLYDFDRVDIMENVLKPLLELSKKGTQNHTPLQKRMYNKGFKRAEWLITHFISDVLDYEKERKTSDIIL